MGFYADPKRLISLTSKFTDSNSVLNSSVEISVGIPLKTTLSNRLAARVCVCETQFF